MVSTFAHRYGPLFLHVLGVYLEGALDSLDLRLQQEPVLGPGRLVDR